MERSLEIRSEYQLLFPVQWGNHFVKILHSDRRKKCERKLLQIIANTFLRASQYFLFASFRKIRLREKMRNFAKTFAKLVRKFSQIFAFFRGCFRSHGNPSINTYFRFQIEETYSQKYKDDKI